MTLLNFYSTAGLRANPGVFPTDVQHGSYNHLDYQDQAPQVFPNITEPSRPLFQGLENIARNNGLDGNFDVCVFSPLLPSSYDDRILKRSNFLTGQILTPKFIVALMGPV